MLLRYIYTCLLALWSITSLAYYGHHSTEATLEFEGSIEVDFAASKGLAAAQRSRNVKTSIDYQLQHLMGHFQSPSFRREFSHLGALGERYSVTLTDIAPSTSKNLSRVSYRFTGVTVFNKGAFRSGDTQAVPIRLPLNPHTLYQELQRKYGLNAGVKPCTDEREYGESDFWYFWDPFARGCVLKKEQHFLMQSQGSLTRLPNTPLSYPEYDRLYGDNGNNGTLKLSLFFGYIGDTSDLKKVKRRDEGFRSFKEVRENLEEAGFKLVTPNKEQEGFRRYADGRRVKGINFLLNFRKEGKNPLNGEKINIEVELMLGDSSVSARDETFHHYFTQALSRSDVVVYDGHSGLGDNLDLSQLPTVRFSQSKYQIFFFNGCSSYPYYNGDFIKRKGGSKNLEVLTAGLPTLTSTAAPNVMAFVRPFLELDVLSYQRILDLLEDSNGDEESYLSGISGDEDNAFRP